MPHARRPDRLGRDELEALQQRALREWQASDWLAAHDPRAWEALADQDPSDVRIDLGGGVGEREQRSGYVVLDRRWADATDLRTKTGERRIPDIHWDLVNGLPFEAQSVDRLHARLLLRDLETTATRQLPAEMARVLRVGGTLELVDDPQLVESLAAPLTRHGFAGDGQAKGETPRAAVRVMYVLTRHRSPLDDVAPRLVDPSVFGSRVLPSEPRTPVPP